MSIISIIYSCYFHLKLQLVLIFSDWIVFTVQLVKMFFQCYMQKCESNSLCYYFLLWRCFFTGSYQYLLIIPDSGSNIRVTLIKNAWELYCSLSNIIPPPMWTPWELYSDQYNPFTIPVKISQYLQYCQIICVETY